MSLKAIYARLNGDSGFVTSLGATTRIHCEHVPQRFREFPMVLLETEPARRDRTYEGASGVVFQRIVVTTMARTLKQAADLGDAVFTLLDHKRGTWGGVVVQAVTHEDEDETFDAGPELGEPNSVVAKEQTYLIAFNE